MKLELLFITLSVLSAVVSLVFALCIISLFMPSLYYRYKDKIDYILKSKRAINIGLSIVVISDIIILFILNYKNKLQLHIVLSNLHYIVFIILGGLTCVLGLSIAIEEVNKEAYKDCKYMLYCFSIIVSLKLIELAIG